MNCNINFDKRKNSVALIIIIFQNRLLANELANGNGNALSEKELNANIKDIVLHSH